MSKDTNDQTRAATDQADRRQADLDRANKAREEEQANLPPGTRLSPPASQQPSAHAAAAPEYGPDGRLTRRGMEGVLARGGSVSITRQVEGQAPTAIIATHPEHLPSAEELAGTNEQALDAADESLAADQRRLDQRRAALERGRTKAASEKKK
jgi:hypothetical protein